MSCDCVSRLLRGETDMAHLNHVLEYDAAVESEKRIPVPPHSRVFSRGAVVEAKHLTPRSYDELPLRERLHPAVFDSNYRPPVEVVA